MGSKFQHLCLVNNFGMDSVTRCFLSVRLFGHELQAFGSNSECSHYFLYKRARAH